MCAEIQGVIEACVKLSGMPDLTLSFMVKPTSPIFLDCILFVCYLNNFPGNLTPQVGLYTEPYGKFPWELSGKGQAVS